MAGEATTSTGKSSPQFQIPWLIKRNMALFSLCQTFTGAGMQFAYGFGPLMVLQVTGSAGLAGLSTALIGLSRLIVAYPIGKITDRYGRKPGILLGLALALVGALVVGFSMNLLSTALLVVGMLLFAMGMNATHQMRVGATDMFPPQFRAQALGYIALGSLIGLFVSPLMVTVGERLADAHGYDRLGMPWLMLPALIVPGMFMIMMVRPDPKEIGQNLERYYPGYVPPPRPAPGSKGAQPFDWREMWRRPVIRLALISNASAQANMTIVMVMTSLVLSHHGHSLSEIAISHMFHTAGMFAFTIPLGKLTDRIGRVRVMLPGVAIALVGASFVAYTSHYWTVTLGTFLVGLGWAAANVATTALVADAYTTEQRGRAVGVIDTAAGMVTMGTAIIGGPIIEWGGLPSAGLAAMLMALPPLVVALTPAMRRALSDPALASAR